MKRWSIGLLVLLAFLCVPLLRGSATARSERPGTQLRIASLAPQGSGWIDGAESLGREMRQATGNRVGFRLYPGGVQGDDAAIVAKLKEGRLQGALLSGIGLSLLVPSARRLELPFVVDNLEEARRLRQALAPEITDQLAAQHLRVLTWLEAGPFYLFSTRAPTQPSALRGAKAWVVPGDTFASGVFAGMGATPVPLPVSQVRTALAEGTVDTITHLPAACLALQWCSKLTYRMDRPVAFGVGVFVVREDALQKLSAEDQEQLLRGAANMGAVASATTQKQHQAALDTLGNQGIVTVNLASAGRRAFARAGLEGAQAAVGKLYSKEQLSRALQVVSR